MVNLKRGANLTIEQASQGVQISALKREDKLTTISAIVILLSQLKGYVKIDVDDEVLFDWAEMIAEEFYWFRFEDLILAFKKGISQKQYGEVLGSNILQWCREYEVKRTQYHVNRHKDFKESYDPNRNSETTIKNYLK